MKNAILGGQAQVVALLLELQTPFAEDILDCAIENGNLQIFRALVEAWRPTAHAPKMILEACNRNQVDILTYLAEAGYVTEETLQRVDKIRSILFTAHAAELYADVGGVFTRDEWGCMGKIERASLLRVAVAHARRNVGLLPEDFLRAWFLFHVRYKARLCSLLARVRARLDRPPTEPLGVTENPTRDQMIVHLRTAGRRFAREYWDEGRLIFFPSLDLGPVPDEFVFRAAQTP